MKILKDKNVSLKAKGLYFYILNSQDEKISIDILRELNKDGRSSIQVGMNELIELGYLERKQIRGEKNSKKKVFLHYEYKILK